jgi:hypothetical protein
MIKYYTSINESQKTNELLFIKSTHFDKLEIYFDFFEIRYRLYYQYKDNDIFCIIKTKTRNEFHINMEIWSKFTKRIKSEEYVTWVLTNCVNKFFNKNYDTVFGF